MERKRITNTLESVLINLMKECIKKKKHYYLLMSYSLSIIGIETVKREEEAGECVRGRGESEVYNVLDRLR